LLKWCYFQLSQWREVKTGRHFLSAASVPLAGEGRSSWDELQNPFVRGVPIISCSNELSRACCCSFPGGRRRGGGLLKAVLHTGLEMFQRSRCSVFRFSLPDRIQVGPRHLVMVTSTVLLPGLKSYIDGVKVAVCPWGLQKLDSDQVV